MSWIVVIIALYNKLSNCSDVYLYCLKLYVKNSWLTEPFASQDITRLLKKKKKRFLHDVQTEYYNILRYVCPRRTMIILCLRRVQTWLYIIDDPSTICTYMIYWIQVKIYLIKCIIQIFYCVYGQFHPDELFYLLSHGVRKQFAKSELYFAKTLFDKTRYYTL